MTVFIVIAARLTLVALEVVLPPLLRRGSRPALARAPSNLVLLQDQLPELESDLKSGIITAERYHQARAELEGRVLEEVRPETTAAAAPAAGRSPWLAAALALLIPVAAGLMYLQTGSPMRCSCSPPRAIRTATAGIRSRSRKSTRCSGSSMRA